MFDISHLKKLLNEGDIFIDCGANIGQETLPMAKEGAIVYAFEPNPYAFARLKELTMQYPNVHLYNQAVWDRSTTMKLYLHENSAQDEVHWSTGSSLVEEKENVMKDKYVEVEVIDIVEFIRNLGARVKVLKVDVEGSEFEIIERLITTGLCKEIEYIFVETHEQKIPALMAKAEEVRELIRNNGITNINLDWI